MEKSCCELAELSGLYSSMGSLSLLGRGRLSMSFSGQTMAVCRRAYTLLSAYFNITPQLHYTDHARFGGRRQCVLTIGPNESPAVLCAFGMASMENELRLLSPIPKYTINKGCCTKAFLRGLFLGGGTLSAPEGDVHMEFPCREAMAKQTAAKCMQKLGFPVHFSIRREHEYMYLKQSEQVIELLRLLGATHSASELEEAHIRRQVYSQASRSFLCDQANLAKTLAAGDKQINAIRLLEKAGRLPSLPPALREIAEKRLEAPEATLTELGQMLNPPIGKSGVNHRLRRLTALAEEEEDHETQTD